MTDATPAPSTAPTAPVPRKRLTPLILSVTLTMEAMLVFFASLTAFGLRVLDPVTAFVGGGVLFLVFLMSAGTQRRPWGARVGWALQVLLLALGILLDVLLITQLGFVIPAMTILCGGLVGFWIYCWIIGRRIDARNDQLEADALSADTTTATT